MSTRRKQVTPCTCWRCVLNARQTTGIRSNGQLYSATDETCSDERRVRLLGTISLGDLRQSRKLSQG
jgi:hypothetical protein